MSTNDNTIYIGLCMAGAISAGAYTAGVMDYLVEALEEWEKRRGQEDVPTHRVVIPVMGGSSAGGMTAIMAAGALNDPVKPVRSLATGDINQRIPWNKFYHSWVDLTRDDMFPLMLSNSDIKNNKVQSLLNSDFIDEIAARVVKVDGPRVNRPYIDTFLKLFVTLTNLEGFSYNIAFRADNPTGNNYFLEKHNDYACFIWDELNCVTPQNGWIPLSFSTGLNTGIARDAAMATGAFPIGLKARQVVRSDRDINSNPWISGIARQPFATKTPWPTLNIDGGLINNEPFELVRLLLNSVTGEGKTVQESLQRDYQRYETFKSTILMIDPFPSEKTSCETDDSLMGVTKSTIKAMMGQLRIKPENLINAMDSNDSGQYIIAPKRRFPGLKNMENNPVQGAGAIACGSLGGFGGFLNKEFRIHDFFLGRANCEQFLRYHFNVPLEAHNKIIDSGYKEVRNLDKFLVNGNKKNLPIIPLFSTPTQAPYMPVFSCGGDWPRIREADINRYRKDIRKRIGKILPNLFPNYKTALKIAGSLGLNCCLASKVTTAMKKQIEGHRLLRS